MLFITMTAAAPKQGAPAADKRLKKFKKNFPDPTCHGEPLRAVIFPNTVIFIGNPVLSLHQFMIFKSPVILPNL